MFSQHGSGVCHLRPFCILCARACGLPQPFGAPQPLGRVAAIKSKYEVAIDLVCDALYSSLTAFVAMMCARAYFGACFASPLPGGSLYLRDVRDVCHARLGYLALVNLKRNRRVSSCH